MRYIVLVILGLVNIKCANSDFSETNAKANLPHSVESENAEGKPSETSLEVEEKNIVDYSEANSPATEQVDGKLCLAAARGEVSSVVSLSQGDLYLSKITPNSILLLQAQGQANIDLSVQEISTLKGICIFATGEAVITLDLNATVSSMFFYGRGSATTTLDFKTTGTLAKLETDLSGQSQLNLSGQSLKCDELELVQDGYSKVQCNGQGL